MTGIIQTVHARQILDSRGRPTVEAEVTCYDGTTARASVPSGASTGKAEAIELRDGGSSWGGQAVRQAVRNVVEKISPVLKGRNIQDQQSIDDEIRAIDGTDNFAALGANAALAVSLACLRTSASGQGVPLFRRIAQLAGCQPLLPMPMVNILSGGLHAGRGMDVQDFLFVPIGAGSYSEALEWVCRVRSTATELCEDKGLPLLLADEGGLSPGFDKSTDALDLMTAAFERAGLMPGRDAAIAIDVAASSLMGTDGLYHFARLDRSHTSHSMIEMLAEWVRTYPIVSVEDGLGEDDWDNWPRLRSEIGHIQVVGDDIFATQPDRVQRGIVENCANAALIKVNQNGSFSGTLEAVAIARNSNFATVVSARSGETEDEMLADLAVGLGGGQIKVGSVRSSERLAKYNQLLRIEECGIPWAGCAGFAPR